MSVVLAAFARRARSLAEQGGLPVGRLPSTGTERPVEGWYLEETASGLALRYTERGGVETVVEGSLDDVLYEVFYSLTGDAARSWELAHRRPGEDSRRQWMPRQVEALRRLRPAWGERAAAQHGATLAEHPFVDG